MDAALIHNYLVRIPGWQAVAVSDFDLIGEGWESRIYGFTARLPDSELDLVLRMYTGADGADKALTESGGMPRLRAAGYPVPQVFLFELDAVHLGLPFIVMERVKGRQLWGEMARQPEHRTELENAFVDLLIELHGLDWRPFLSNGGEVTTESLIRRDLKLWHDVVAATPAAGFEAALDWFDKHAAGLTPCQPSVVHNDFHPGNILLTERGETFVVDWTSLGVADPRSDLAWALMLMEFVDGAAARHRVQERYATSLITSDLDFFMAGAYVKRLFSLVVSLTYGPETLGMRPGAAGEMRRHLAQAGPMYDEFRRITGHRLAAFEELSGA